MTEIDALGAWVPTETEEIEGSELWSLDATLTDYILPRIKAFRSMERHGYPVLGKNMAEVATDDSDDDDKDSLDDEFHEAEWENILFDIEKGFEAHKKIIDDNETDQIAALVPDEFVESEKTMQKGLQLFAKYYNHLWD